MRCLNLGLVVMLAIRGDGTSSRPAAIPGEEDDEEEAEGSVQVVGGDVGRIEAKVEAAEEGGGSIMTGDGGRRGERY